MKIIKYTDTYEAIKIAEEEKNLEIIKN